jgi:hypothetical protein
MEYKSLPASMIVNRKRNFLIETGAGKGKQPSAI